MKIQEMANEIEANGDCLRSFAKTMKVIETQDAEALARTLQAFVENDDPGNTSFAEIALPEVTEAFAWQDMATPGSSIARELGIAFAWFIETARLKRDSERDTDYKFVTEILGAIKDRENFSCKSAVMKSLCMDAPTIHTGPGIELEQTYESFRCVEFRGHKLDPTYHYEQSELLNRDSDGDEIVSLGTIRIGYQTTVAIQVLDDATAADVSRILRKVIASIEQAGLPSAKWTEHTEHPSIAHINALRKREVGEPAASLASLSESLDAAEPKHEDEEAIPEATVLKRKFDAFKESTADPVKVTLQVWGPIEGCSDHGMEITEEEFGEVLEMVRKMRAGYELAPDPDLIEATVSAFRNAEASVRLRKKEVQPQE